MTLVPLSLRPVLDNAEPRLDGVRVAAVWPLDAVELFLSSDASDALIVRSTIDLAHNLGLSVVAEGVEDDPTLERLRAMNCDMVQGYLLSRPLGVIETEAWMRGSIWTKAPGEITALRRVV